MRYIGKKLAAMMITLLCISFLVYLAFDLIPEMRHSRRSARTPRRRALRRCGSSLG